MVGTSDKIPFSEIVIDDRLTDVIVSCQDASTPFVIDPTSHTVTTSENLQVMFSSGKDTYGKVQSTFYKTTEYLLLSEPVVQNDEAVRTITLRKKFDGTGELDVYTEYYVDNQFPTVSEGVTKALLRNPDTNLYYKYNGTSWLPCDGQNIAGHEPLEIVLGEVKSNYGTQQYVRYRNPYKIADGYQVDQLAWELKNGFGESAYTVVRENYTTPTATNTIVLGQKIPNKSNIIALNLENHNVLSQEYNLGADFSSLVLNETLPANTRAEIVYVMKIAPTTMPSASFPLMGSIKIFGTLEGANGFGWGKEYQLVDSTYKDLLAAFTDWYNLATIVSASKDRDFPYKIAPNGFKFVDIAYKSNVDNYYQVFGKGDYIIFDSSSKIAYLPRITRRTLIKKWREGAEWYNIYNDGWVEQGGQALCDGTWTTNTLKIPFADINYTIGGNFIYSANASTFTSSMAIAKVSNSQFQSASASGQSSYYGGWAAEGYTDLSALGLDNQVENVYFRIGDTLTNPQKVSAEAVVARVEAISGVLDNSDYVVDSWTSSDGLGWYRIYKSGWIEQGGVVPAAEGTGTLYRKYASADYNIQATPRSSADGGLFSTPANAFPLTDKTFKYGAINGLASSTISWRACGKGA